MRHKKETLKGDTNKIHYKETFFKKGDIKRRHEHEALKGRH